MYSKTLQALEQFAVQFSLLLRLGVYDEHQTMQLQRDTERNERACSETTKFMPSSALRYVEFLFRQQKQIAEDFAAQFPAEEIGRDAMYSRRRAVEICFRYLNQASLQKCRLLIGLLERLGELKKMQPKFFDVGILRFPNAAFFYCLRAAYVHDIQQNRQIFYLNWYKMTEFDEAYTFFGNWLQFEAGYVRDMLPEGITPAQIEDDKLRKIAEGQLIAEVLKMAVLQLAGCACSCYVSEPHRIQLLRTYGTDLSWKIAFFRDARDVLTVRRVQESLKGYSALLGASYRLYLDQAMLSIEEVRRQRLAQLAEKAIPITDLSYRRCEPLDAASGASSAYQAPAATSELFGED